MGISRIKNRTENRTGHLWSRIIEVKKGSHLNYLLLGFGHPFGSGPTGESVKSFGDYFEIFGIEGKITNQGKTNKIRDSKLA
jgi:hypothetical protein